MKVWALIASQNEHWEYLKLIAEKNGDVTSADTYGQTPRNVFGNNNWNSQMVWVMYSALYGKLECTMAILKAGADVNVQNKRGETAGDFIFFSLCIPWKQTFDWAYHAAMMGKIECLRHLSDQDADFSISSNKGMTPGKLFLPTISLRQFEPWLHQETNIGNVWKWLQRRMVM